MHPHREAGQVNPILTESGPLSRAGPVVLELFNDGLLHARGVFSDLGEAEADVESVFSKSGPSIWIPLPDGVPSTRIAFATVAGRKWRVLDREVLGHARFGYTVRLQLVQP